MVLVHDRHDTSRHTSSSHPHGLDDVSRLEGRGGRLRPALVGRRARGAVAAVLLDMDGVLADVSLSYRVCVVETAARYGVRVTQQDIVSAKAAGLYNNDWVLTEYLVRKGAGDPGARVRMISIWMTSRETSRRSTKGWRAVLWARDNERLIVAKGLLEELARRATKAWPS